MEYGLIGKSLTHSFSKFLHSVIGDYNYELKELNPESLEDFIKSKDYKGINVTIPYKEMVIPFLDFVDEKAQEIGAVNTVVNKGGKLYGYNTDYFALKALIEKAVVEVRDKKVLILGTGGTSKTAFCVAKALGAREIIFVSRKESENAISYDTAYTKHTDTDVIINTTPVGMYPNIDAAPISLDNFKNLSGLVDVIYNPLNTNLVLKARENGVTAVNGLYMLIYQGVLASELFFDKKILNCEIERITKTVFEEKKNIVLIGMPTSGKTTLGKILSKDMNKQFVDTDEEIEKKENMSISQIFALKGEEYFRNLETNIIKDLSTSQALVIATGGGAVLRDENVEYLKRNGKIVFLDRSIENLISTDSRPLAKDKTDLERLYERRYEIYNKACDLKVSVNGSIEENITALKEVL